MGHRPGHGPRGTSPATWLGSVWPSTRKCTQMECVVGDAKCTNHYFYLGSLRASFPTAPHGVPIYRYIRTPSVGYLTVRSAGGRVDRVCGCWGPVVQGVRHPVRRRRRDFGRCGHFLAPCALRTQRRTCCCVCDAPGHECGALSEYTILPPGLGRASSAPGCRPAS